MNTEFSEKISKTLSEYIVFYSEFLEFEQNKLLVVENNKLELLDGLVKQEEAYLLKSRGMEQNRIETQKAYGYEGKTLKELIELSPEDKKAEFAEAFVKLNEIVYELQRTNEHCSIAIKARLKAIERAMDKIKNEDGQKTYDDAANSKQSGRAFFSSKV